MTIVYERNAKCLQLHRQLLLLFHKKGIYELGNQEIRNVCNVSTGMK